MEKDHRLRHDAHKRANGACDEHRGFFEATVGGRKTLATLDTATTDVARLFLEQESYVMEGRAAVEQCRRIRRTIRNALRLVVKVVAMAQLDNGVVLVTRMPRVASDDELLAEAGAILNIVTEHADALIEEGLPPDFLDTLASQIARLEGARNTVTRARQNRTAATEAIGRALNSGDRAIAVLEALLVHALDASPDALVMLRQAKRVGGRVNEAAPPRIIPLREVA